MEGSEMEGGESKKNDLKFITLEVVIGRLRGGFPMAFPARPWSLGGFAIYAPKNYLLLGHK